jgi:hypothetical protein
MPVNSFIFKAYFDLIAQLHESVIIEKILSMFQTPKPFITDDRVALSLDHLMVWFKLWIGLLLIASLAFFAEL